MKKILLLDDDQEILLVVEALFIMERFEVQTTNTCTNFIPMAEEFRPDTIILDYRLSNGNGGEICRKLKAHPSFKNTPVIIFSAFAQPDFDFMQFGCDEFIAKPFDIDELVGATRRLLGFKQLSA
ncbi:response regulator transcription factor [Mucilaginibacter antarcticus]|uniref:Response regulator transcription factor n=1 Tax=Mucilaginibacter antarcticus TaxID=1855725 RepID=A0ABW5XLV3_9SPHI